MNEPWRLRGCRIELWSMHHITPDEAVLLFGRRVSLGIAREARDWMVTVVAPFSEVVHKLQARCVGVGVLEINHDQLSMFICRMKQW